MKKVLVTGGSGFLGGHIVQECSRRGMDVTVWDKVKPKYDANYEYVQVDLTKPLYHVGLTTCKFDYIFHAAGELGSLTTFERIKSTFDVNINSMLNLMDWVKYEPAYVENDWDAEEVRQHTAPHVINCGLIRDWLNPYMISKHAAAQIGQMYRKYYGVKFLDCRMTVVFGQRQGWKEEKVVPTFIRNMLSDKDIVFFGDGMSVMNMMYVKDVAKLLVDIIGTAAFFESSSPHTLDIANQRGDITIKSFAKVLRSMIPTQSATQKVPMRIGQPGNVGVSYNIAPVSKHIELDNYFRPLRDSLLETIAWYRQDYLTPHI